MIVGQMGILKRLWYAKGDGIDIYNPYVQINIIHFYLFTIITLLDIPYQRRRRGCRKDVSRVCSAIAQIVYVECRLLSAFIPSFALNFLLN